MVVCNCRYVDEATIKDELFELGDGTGCGTDIDDIFNHIVDKTEACTGCGKCEPRIKDLIEEHKKVL
jgi:NAD(P)H-nitrite reductase large subunit